MGRTGNAGTPSISSWPVQLPAASTTCAALKKAVSVVTVTPPADAAIAADGSECRAEHPAARTMPRASL